MTKRRAITKKLAVDALLHRVFLHFGVYLPCAISGEPMMPGDAVQFDHIHAHALDGPHVYDNLRPVLAKPHLKKTKADLRMIKKTRPGHAQKFAVKRTVLCFEGEEIDLGTAVIPMPAKPKRKFPKGRKIPSRPFRRVG